MGLDIPTDKGRHQSRRPITPNAPDSVMTQVLRTKKTANQTQKMIKQIRTILLSVCTHLSHSHELKGEEKESKNKNSTFL